MEKYNLIIKYTDNYNSENWAITQLCSIQQELGYAWFGKIGKRISSTTISDLNKKIVNSETIGIIFLGRYRKKIYVSEANLLQISKKRPCNNEFPSYYENLLITTWFKVSNIRSSSVSILDRLIGKSSCLPVRLTIFKTSASVIVALRSGNNG